MTAGTLILENNLITNCDATLTVEGEEVFRLRERGHDGQLIVDFDLRDERDERLAKIAKNHVVYVASGIEPRSQPGRYDVVNTESGAILARVEELSPGTVRVTGTFFVKGWKVEATLDGVTLGGVAVSGSSLEGCGGGIELRKDSVAIGVGKR